MSLSLYRSNITRLTKEKANLENDLARERKKISQLRTDISSLMRSITNSTSFSTQQSKQRQIDSKEKELTQCQKKAAELEIKIATRVADLNRILQNLERAEEQERKRQDTDTKQRRNEEVRHSQTITREIEKQVQLQAKLKNSPLVIDLSRLPEKIKVLFVASNPLDQNELRLDEEIRAITQKIRASEHRDSVELVSSWATRPSDLLQTLNEHKPHVVHFSGHGSDSGELVFQADDGSTKLVSTEVIVTTMSTIIDNIRVVVFNACHSHTQAEAVTQHIDVAIGMNDAIGDDAARVFAAQFYSAIGFGCSIKQAFEQGIAALLLEGIPEYSTPVIFTHDNVYLEDVVLVRPPIWV